MGLKLKALLEGYAWERKPDGSLPTLKDAIAVHEANKGAKPDYIDIDKDGDTEEPKKKAAKEVNEGHLCHETTSSLLVICFHLEYRK